MIHCPKADTRTGIFTLTLPCPHQHPCLLYKSLENHCLTSLDFPASSHHFQLPRSQSPFWVWGGGEIRIYLGTEAHRGRWWSPKNMGDITLGTASRFLCLPHTCPYPVICGPIPSPQGPTLTVMATGGLRPAWKLKDVGEGLERRQVEGRNERIR